MLKGRETRKNKISNLASLLKFTAKTFTEIKQKYTFARQTMSLLCKQMISKYEIHVFYWIQSCQELYLSDTFIFFIVLSPTVCLFWHSSEPLLPCPSELFEGNEKQQSFLRFRLKGTSRRWSLVHHSLCVSPMLVYSALHFEHPFS